MSKSAPWFAGAAAIVLADQLTKWLVLARFAPGERLELTSFFNMILVFNKGAAARPLSRSAPRWSSRCCCCARRSGACCARGSR
jgi:signal peptidase II